MNELTSFNPSTFLGSTFQIDSGVGFEYIRFINNSPYLLRINLGGQGTFVFPENYLEDIGISRQFNGQIQIVPYANFPSNAISQAISSLVSINTYVPGELNQPQAQPITTLAAVGGGALSTTQTLVNFGQPQPTAIITASPQASIVSGFGNTAIVVHNDGSLSAGGNPDPAHDFGGYVLFDNAGDITAASIAPNTKLPTAFTFLKSNNPVALIAGNQETGYTALANNNGVTAGLNPNIVGVNPKMTWHAAPTGITFTADATTNVNAPFASDLNILGFGTAATQPANGFTRWLGSWVTTGL